MKIIDTLLSLVKITLKSKFLLKEFHAAEKSVVIVGNGPSAKGFLDNFKLDEQMPTMCVNMFAIYKFNLSDDVKSMMNKVIKRK